MPGTPAGAVGAQVRGHCEKCRRLIHVPERRNVALQVLVELQTEARGHDQIPRPGQLAGVQETGVKVGREE
jgi:hypothetical protein